MMFHLSPGGYCTICIQPIHPQTAGPAFASVVCADKAVSWHLAQMVQLGSSQDKMER